MKKQKKLQKAVDNGLSFNKEKDGDTGKYALQGAWNMQKNMELTES